VCVGVICDYIKEEKLLSLLAPAELADVAWAWGAMRYLPDHDLLDGLGAYLRCIYGAFTVYLRCIYGVFMVYSPPSLIPRPWRYLLIAGELISKMFKATPHDLSVAGWAFAVLAQATSDYYHIWIYNPPFYSNTRLHAAGPRHAPRK
jgi:hypothetical protein